MNYSKDNIIIKTLGNIINKMNYIIEENKKNIKLIRNDINKLYNKFDELKINNTINNQQLKYNNGDRYIGQVVNGMPEGKGICYYNNGNRYEGDFRNGLKEGKGIYYHNNGDRTIVEFYNYKPIGKHVTLTKNGIVKEVNY